MLLKRAVLVFLTLCIMWKRVEAQENEELVVVPDIPEDVVLVDRESEFHAPQDGEYNIVNEHAKEHAHHDSEYNIVRNHAKEHAHHNVQQEEQSEQQEHEETFSTQPHQARIAIPEVRVRTLASDGTAIDTQRYSGSSVAN